MLSFLFFKKSVIVEQEQKFQVMLQSLKNTFFSLSFWELIFRVKVIVQGFIWVEM